MEKIKLTKEYVKKQFIKTLFYKRIKNYIASTGFLILAGIILWFMASYNLFSNPIAYYPLLMFAPFIIAAVYTYIFPMFELIKIMQGKFFITTDEVTERMEKSYNPNRKNYEITHKYNQGNPHQLWFKQYGCYDLHRMFLPFENKTISAKRQLEDTYLGDVYYLAVLRGSEPKIAMIFDSKYYTVD